MAQKTNLGKLFLGPYICFWLWKSNPSTAFLHYILSRSNAPSIIFHKHWPKWSHWESVDFGVPNSKKKLTFCTRPNWQYFWKNFQYLFEMFPNLLKLQFGYLELLFTKNLLWPKKVVSDLKPLAHKGCTINQAITVFLKIFFFICSLRLNVFCRTSQSSMSKLFRFSESLGILGWSRIWNFLLIMGVKSLWQKKVLPIVF